MPSIDRAMMAPIVCLMTHLPHGGRPRFAAFLDIKYRISHFKWRSVPIFDMPPPARLQSSDVQEEPPGAAPRSASTSHERLRAASPHVGRAGMKDVVVIGAGAAGLAAARDLSQAGR